VNLDKLSIKNSFTKNDFTLNILTLAGGTAFAQAIGIIFIPLITRLYTPYDYGNYALYIAVFNLLVPLTHFRYALAIMLPKEDHEALEVLRLSLRLSIFFGVFFLTLFLFIDFAFLQLSGITDNIGALFLISLVLIFGGMIQSLTEWTNRMKNFLLMSVSRVTHVSGMVFSQAIAGFFLGSTLIGLIVGHFLGHLLELTLLIRGNKNLRKNSLLFSAIPPLINNLKRYKKFPLYSSWGSILDGISSYGTPLLLAIYFQPDMVGRYALANMALSAPTMLIGQSISKVLYQKLSEHIKNGLEIKSLVQSVLVRQALIALLFGIVIYIFGPTLFSFFFGSNWVSAGHLAQILVPAMFFHFIVSGLSSVLLANERQDMQLLAQTIRAIITVLSILIPGISGFDEITLLVVFSFSRAFANFVYLLIICKVARVF
jgi:O-antigen/teichoic acid export membrane protein